MSNGSQFGILNSGAIQIAPEFFRPELDTSLNNGPPRVIREWFRRQEVAALMELRIFCIAGFRPSVKWKKNSRRKKRTIEEATDIARQHGVEIPVDVVFYEAATGIILAGSLNDLFAGKRMETARYTRIDEHRDGFIYWNDHYHKTTGKIPVIVHPDVFTSDEAIVAVFQHECFELSQIRQVCMLNQEDDRKRRMRMNATDYGIQVSEHISDNYHCQAWDAADALVLQIRENSP